MSEPRAAFTVTNTVTPIYNANPPQVKYNALYRLIYYQVYEQNGNAVILVMGKPGKGKSEGVLGMAYDLMRDYRNNPTFSVFRNVCYSFEEFLNKVEASETKGEVFILDEGGTNEGLQSRNFASLNNKIASSLFQTMRVKGQILFVIAPAGLMIDKQVKFTCHIDLTFKGHDNEKSWAEIRVHDDDLWEGKFYRKHMQSIIGGERYKLKKMFFDRPPGIILEQYEWWQKIRKQYMQTKWKRQVREELDFKEGEGKLDDTRVSFADAYAEVIQNPDNFIGKQGRIVAQEIRAYYLKEGLSISESIANSVAKAASRHMKTGG